MKTREFNLNNWTGETVVISYAVKQRTFDFQGETYFLGEFTVLDCGLAAVSLYGVSWDGALTHLTFQTDHNTPTLMEAAVIAATRYAANHV